MSASGRIRGYLRSGLHTVELRCLADFAGGNDVVRDAEMIVSAHIG